MAITTFIWRFIVRQNNVMKYITRIGQKTGTLKTSKKVQKRAITVDLETEYQNLNSGSLLINGRNSSFALVGNSGPSTDSEAVTFKIRLYFCNITFNTFKI